jgi:hypothetical protein
MSSKKRSAALANAASGLKALLINGFSILDALRKLTLPIATCSQATGTQTTKKRFETTN